MTAAPRATTSLVLAAFAWCGCSQTIHANAPNAGAVRVSAERVTSGYAVVVSNDGRSSVSFAGEVTVERATGDSWTAVETSGLELRTSCHAPRGVIEPAPRCVSIAAGTTLRAAPWLGTTGDAQCICERCVAVPAGRYRFVLHSCAGTAAIAGEPFTVTGTQ